MLGLFLIIKGPSLLLLFCFFLLVVYLLFLKNLSYVKWIYSLAFFLVFIGIAFIHEQTNESMYKEGLLETTIVPIMIPRLDGDRLSMTVRTEENEKLQVVSYIKEQKYKEQLEQIKPGERCRVKGNLEIPSSATNFYAFDYAEFLYQNKIHWVYNIDGPISCKNTNPSLYYSFQQYRQNQMKKLESLHLEMSSLMIALLFGDRFYFETDVINAYQRLGILHLLAISGLHVGIIVAALFYSMIRIGITRERAQELLLVFLPIYAIFAGAAPPVLRATAMTFIAICFWRFQKKLEPLLSISIVFFLYLMLDPYAIFQLGFQLSFAISFGLILSATWIQSFSTHYFYRLIVVSALCQFLSFPFIVYHFYEQSWFQLPLNLIYIPFISLIVLPFVLASYLLYLILPVITYHLIHFIDPVMLFIHRFLIWIESQLNVYILFGRPSSFVLFALCTIMIYTLVLLERKPHYWIRKLLVVWTVLITFHFINPYLQSHATVTMIDVGQGDSILIEFPYRKAVYLIDTGGTISFPKEEWQIRNSAFEVGEDILVPFLKAKGIRKIDKLILTHGDYDHVGGVEGLLKHIAVDEIIYPVGELDEGEINLFKIWSQHQSNLTFVREGDKWKEGNAYFKVLSPSGDEEGRNERSIVLYLYMERISLLFMGDLEEEGEQKVIENYPQLKADILKVGHHGSKTSTTIPFVSQIEPSLALISAGRNNRFGHPYPKVIETLEEHQVTIYRTDQDGAVEIKLKQGKININQMMQ
ncbi:DNA internalization-related competence protein ComEC/Rec2 [Alkalihalobacillus trypoxylicola]|uniref:DNA internalization-related competence protein ComEC/Rec2 n=1 Tax=Alkalihalobacillus trypoxylicola TaxID=519424 RepID=UPI001F21DF0A|nr:DNA internalization-related competence protein ComEC/Rec2 [Alkalihalobacillus trypoxylicola]